MIYSGKYGTFLFNNDKERIKNYKKILNEN